MTKPGGAAATLKLRNLAVLSYAQGFTHWHYRHDSAMVEVLQPGFFSPATDMFAQGDRIIVSGIYGSVDLHVVKKDQHLSVVALQATVLTLFPVE